MTTDFLSTRFTFGRTPRRALAAVLAALAVLAAVLATINWSVASARDDTVVGEPVTEKQMTAIVTAAHSCPMLDPARIAGQLMAESGLNNRERQTASGGRGIAGLDDEDWTRWKPWPDARRSDVAASILALAHQMCDFSGQLRLAGIPGDHWRLSVAAFHGGLPAVAEAKAVPAEAVEYVDLVSGYAGYYGRLRQFGGDGVPTPTPPPANDAKGVPAEYVPLVVQAGSVCDQVTPPMVAAQLMTLSGFDANLLGPTGQRGIAQFLPEVWQAYGPEGGSAWEPTVAVPTVGIAMCALVSELSGLDGDPYLLALAAYRNGPTAVRQTAGRLDQPTETFLRAVKALTDLYVLDTRLGRPAPVPPAPTTTAPEPPEGESSPAPTSEPPPLASEPKPPADQPDPPASDPKPPASEPKPTTAAPKPVRPAGMKQIFHPRTGRCVSSGKTGDGTRLLLKPCTEDPAQWWDFRTDGTIRARGLCMDIAWAGSTDGTAIQVAVCSGNAAQSWQFNSKGGIISKLNGKSVDVNMNVKSADKPLELWIYVGNAEQTWRKR
ncbi:ricin-type beta-trefoil lectin domain protein [Micromonospora sp. C95]|uniref:ricin-type beta-trefoil lectin domain protein n=1 Tax=Micromonospora sp. C95 TaxID=2824882 RepID=UPI001B36B826|nr:ricin-type beta-trefoil lectin domain protein [Micromonospora sp. C95]MBQ1027867.1 ricin-type beta-trefoil lectin domain protein [Micromonospora sp. C95]